MVRTRDWRRESQIRLLLSSLFTVSRSQLVIFSTLNNNGQVKRLGVYQPDVPQRYSINFNLNWILPNAVCLISQIRLTNSTEASLSGVEPLMQKIQNEIRTVDAGILAAVRQQVCIRFISSINTSTHAHSMVWWLCFSDFRVIQELKQKKISRLLHVP